MERVLVTGCGGFVGKVLTPFLDAEGYETWGIDRGDARGNVAPERYVSGDLQDEDNLGRALERVGPDGIIHLAAQSSGGISFAEPHRTITNNILPILHLLEFLRKTASKARLLAVGSADVYGPVGRGDLPLEESRPPNPNNPYALSKAIQEQCCGQYAALYGVDVVSTRSFNHTGAGRPDTFVLSSFAKQIVEIKRGSRKPVVEVGNIEVKRDFSDVRDVARAYVLLLKKGRRGEIYNVCTGVSRSLREMLEKLAALAGVDVEIRVDKERLRPADMDELRGDNSKITGDTGWAPSISIEDTLRSLLDYWDEQIGRAGGRGS